jgi:hypothetical protein
MLLTYSIVAMWLLLALGTLLGVSAWIVRTREAVTVLSGVAITCLILALITIGVWTWILRDGLGPDSVPSEGSVALLRFWKQLWPIAIYVAAGVAFVIASWRHRVNVLARRWAP